MSSVESTAGAPRTAVVAGGSAGIGRAIAETLARAGWQVAVGARGPERLEATIAAIERDGGRATGIRLDVTDAASIDAFLEAVEEALGPADAIVVCAAHARPARLWERPVEAIRDEIETGLTGALLVARAGVARLVARGVGDVLFVSSTTAAVPWPYFATYAAAKAGLEQAARTLALELEGTGVRAGIVRVGNTIGTDWAASWEAPEFAHAQEWHRFGVMRHDRFMQPADVAAVVRRVLETPHGVQLGLTTVDPEAPVGEQTPRQLGKR